MGYSATDPDFNAVHKSGGSKTVNIGIENLPAHSHSVNDPGHTHPYSAPLVSGSHPGGSSGYDRPNSPNNGNSGTAKTNITIGSVGGNVPLKTLIPYNTLVYIIYVG